VKIEVKVSGFKEGAAMFRGASRRFKKVMEKQLQKFGDDLVRETQARIQGGDFGPPKVRGDGPPLYDKGIYCKSFEARANGTKLLFGPEGDNLNMSNAALSELLEYGTKKMPARPHIRAILTYAERTAPRYFNEDTLRGLLGNSLRGEGSAGRRSVRYDACAAPP